MAIPVSELRTPTMKTRIAKYRGVAPTDVCELCWLPLKDDVKNAAVLDCERYEFLTDAEAEVRHREAAEAGRTYDPVEPIPVGPDCAKRIKRALACAAT